MIGSTPAETKTHPGTVAFVETDGAGVRACVRAPTCWRVLQQLLELRRGELRAGGGHDHADLRELGFDVGLLQVGEERGGGDALGRAVGRTLHQVNNHLRPTKKKQTTQHEGSRETAWHPDV